MDQNKLASSYVRTNGGLGAPGHGRGPATDMMTDYSAMNDDVTPPIDKLHQVFSSHCDDPISSWTNEGYLMGARTKSNNTSD